jgi:ATP-dependent Lon protease
MPKNRAHAYDPSDSLLTSLPERIPVMPIKSTVVFPTGATGLQLSFPPNVQVLSLNPGKTLVVALVATEEEDSPIDPATIEKIGVATRVLNRLNLPGGTIQATIQGLIRIHLEGVRYENGFYTAYPRLVEEVPADGGEAEQIIEQILTTLNGIGAKVDRLAEVPRILRRNTGDPGRFADLVATLAHFSVQEKDAVLQRLDITDRLEYVLETLRAEWKRVLQVEEEAGAVRQPEARDLANASERSNAVRRQIAALQAELGEIEPAEKEVITMLRRIEQAQLPTGVASIARREAERLRTALSTSAEATEIRTYLDTLLGFPWDRSTDGAEIDLTNVSECARPEAPRPGRGQAEDPRDPVSGHAPRQRAGPGPLHRGASRRGQALAGGRGRTGPQTAAGAGRSRRAWRGAARREQPHPSRRQAR